MSAGLSGWSFVKGVAASTVFVALVVALLLYLDLQTDVVRFLSWLDGMGLWAPLLFSLVMAAVVVFLLPGVLLTTGAGFVFGVVSGTLTVVIGTTLGAVIAFLTARKFFGKRAARFILERPNLHMLNAEMPAHAWKIVLVTRLVPFFPAKLANYFFGLTSVSLPAFTGGSLIGFVPFSLHNVYLGAIAAELTTAGLRSSELGEQGWLFYAVGFLLVVGAVLYLSRWAWHVLSEQGSARDSEHS
ncbi:MAG: TVP38/TMEM64 family protein [Xanthomonadales bacterium]|nr:TVP38/TMEM64 family protein [Xanthomonadales bacterium]